MSWINAYHGPVGTTQGMSPERHGNAANRQPDTAFADILASRINAVSRASGNGDILSPETVKLLAMILTRHLGNTLSAGTTWMNDYGAASRLTPPPQPFTAPMPAASPLATETPDHPAPKSEPVASLSRFSSLIDKAASRYQLDPALITSVIETESSFDPKAVSGAGAQGLMQLMPETARELNVTDPLDPAQNIDGGSRYLARLVERYHGDTKLALAAYNWGMGNLERQPEKMPTETRNYVARVMERWDRKRADVA